MLCSTGCSLVTEAKKFLPQQYSMTRRAAFSTAPVCTPEQLDEASCGTERECGDALVQTTCPVMCGVCTPPPCIAGQVDDAACGKNGIYQANECSLPYVRNICPVFCGVCSRPPCTSEQVDSAACSGGGIFDASECGTALVQDECPILCGVCIPVHGHSGKEGKNAKMGHGGPDAAGKHVGKHMKHAANPAKAGKEANEGGGATQAEEIADALETAGVWNWAPPLLRQPSPWQLTSTVSPKPAAPPSAPVYREEGSASYEEAEKRLSWADKVANYHESDGSSADTKGPYGVGQGKGDTASGMMKAGRVAEKDRALHKASSKQSNHQMKGTKEAPRAAAVTAKKINPKSTCEFSLLPFRLSFPLSFFCEGLGTKMVSANRTL